MGIPPGSARRVTAGPDRQPLSRAVRRVAVRFAEVACPPEVRRAGRVEGLLRELDLMLGALPSAARRLVPLALVGFDQAARLYPRARGRRFTRLGDEAAEAYLAAVLGSRVAGLAAMFQRVKGLVVMCYYELPEVQAELRYLPDAYIAEVSKRRLARYGADRDARPARAPGHTERSDLGRAAGL
jgi:hypothetical protein